MKRARAFTLLLAAGLLSCSSSGADGPTGASEDVSASSGSQGTLSAGDQGATETESATMTATSANSEAGGEEGEGTVFSPADQPASCGSLCDVFAQDACPEGQKCTAASCGVGSNSWDTSICVDIEGDKSVGDDCQFFGDESDGLDDCSAGSVCWHADPDTGLGTCIAFCGPPVSNPVCASGTTCAVTADGVAPVCIATCDPLAQDCSHAQEVCVLHPSDLDFVCVQDGSGGNAPRGTPCQFLNGCNEGLLCIDSELVDVPACADSLGCCSPICDTDSPNTCVGAGEACESVGAPASSAGVCMIPDGP